MPKLEIVCIGASAGGVEPLRSLMGALPADFSPSVFVVLHLAPRSPGVLADMLSRAGKLPAAYASDGERIRSGHIYVAPPDRHMVVEPGAIRLTSGPKENRFRPAIDPLFRTAASVYGPLAAGVILSGNLDDGTAGLWAVKRLGGVAIVQHPKEALYPSMPLSALKHVGVDHSLPVADMAGVLVRLANGLEAYEGTRELPSEMDIENMIAREENPLNAGVERLGRPSFYSCPECGGVLLQLKEEHPLRFRCHTGHAYTVQSLLAEIEEKTEEAVWGAVRSFEEGAMLMGQMAERLPARDREKLLRRAEEMKRKSERIRQEALSSA